MLKLYRSLKLLECLEIKAGGARLRAKVQRFFHSLKEVQGENVDIRSGRGDFAPGLLSQGDSCPHGAGRRAEAEELDSDGVLAWCDVG